MFPDKKKQKQKNIDGLLTCGMFARRENPVPDTWRFQKKHFVRS